jgi:hypothetical protein
MKATLLANINIDSSVRLQRMKDSFLSFNKSNVISQYVINVRGDFSDQASLFLKEHSRENLILFNLESSKGWFFDTQKLLDFVSNDLIFIWIEDHICLDLVYFDDVLIDFHKNSIDYLQYSFWLNGLTLSQFSEIVMTEKNNFFIFEHNDISHLNYKKRYLNSLVGVYSKSFFSKILFSKDFVKLWPSKFPFDFERPVFDTWLLPYERAVSKKEIFAPIDDDQDVPGSSLISRGIYDDGYSRLSSAFPSISVLKKSLMMLRSNLRPFKKFYNFIICLFNTPFNFLKDYFISIYFPNKKYSSYIPWMNYKVINFLIKNIKIKDAKIFEYGSGASSRFWLERGAKELVSIEHDEDFYLFNRDSLINRCNYVLAMPQVITEFDHDSFYGSDLEKGYSFENYVNYINNYEDNYFDIIIIDGRARNSCLITCVDKLKSGGIIVFDNSNRERYFNSLFKLKNWHSAIFFGSVRGLLSIEYTQIIYKP